MTNFTELKKLFIKMMLSIVAFSVLILSAVLIPASYAKWQAGSSTVTGTVATGAWEVGYQLTYDINGHGKKPDSFKNVTQLTEEMLPELTDEGFTFEGWYYSSGTKAEVGDMLKDHLSSSNITTVTLQAKWTEKQPEIKPGDDLPSNATVKNGVLIEGKGSDLDQGKSTTPLDTLFKESFTIPAGATFAIYQNGNLVKPVNVQGSISGITYDKSTGIGKNNTGNDITFYIECRAGGTVVVFSN